MVTHSEESTQYGKRVIRLKDGEIVPGPAVTPPAPVIEELAPVLA